jgi:hypothetical protein
MNKLANFINNARAAGAREAMIKLSGGTPPASGLSRILPKSRLGRLGLLGAAGIGAYGMTHKKEESMLDKAQNYVNNLDPAMVNTAMNMYSQMYQNPNTTMGYSPDSTMGVDYSVASPGMDMHEEYPEMYETPMTQEKVSSFLGKKMGLGAGIGALGTIGAAGIGSIANKGLGAVTDDSGMLHRLANIADNLGPYGLLGGTAAGALSAGLSARGENIARSAAKSRELANRVAQRH